VITTPGIPSKSDYTNAVIELAIRLVVDDSLPELRKLREIVEEVYRLYDRRCRRVPPVEKLRKLRDRLQKFKRLSLVLKKIESPTWARSLVFLDDKNLPSTSNAVERGNRIRYVSFSKTPSVSSGIAISPPCPARLNP